MRIETLPSGRVFTFVEAKPYVRKDGTPTTIETWESTCKAEGCGKFFQITVPAGSTPTSSKSFYRVHCEEHKLTPAEATKKWVTACVASNTKVTPEIKKQILDMRHQKFTVPQIRAALSIELSASYIYSLIYKNNS